MRSPNRWLNCSIHFVKNIIVATLRVWILSICAFCILSKNTRADAPVLSFLDVSFGSAKRTASDTFVQDSGPDYNLYGRSIALTQPQATKLQIQLHLDIQPITAAGTIEITAIGGGLTFNTIQSVISGGGTGNQSIFTLVSVGNLPSGTRIINLSLAYYYRVIPPEGSGTWVFLGTSNNKFFLTLSYPTVDATLTRTALNIACQKPGATIESQAIADLWSTISSLSLKNYSGSNLSYYPSGSHFHECANSIETLLLTKKGQCSSFAELMVDCLQSHGIASGEVKTIGPAGQDLMVIKKWSINNIGSQTPPWIYTETALYLLPVYFDMAAGVIGDWSLEPGVAGQNSPSPSQKVFANHVVVSYGQKLYDPSYGKIYNDLPDFVSQALQGTGIRVQPDTFGRTVIHMKSPAVPTDVKFL